MNIVARSIDWTVKTFCLAILVYFALIRGAEPVQLVEAKRGLFEFRVNSETIIRSKSRYTVSAFAQGTMRRLTFKVGDEIKQGAVVTEITIGDKYEPLRAGTTGVISKIVQDRGAIERKDPILEISDPEHMEVVAELTPAEAEQVHLGDPFIISKWGGPDVLKGTVKHIGKPEVVTPVETAAANLNSASDPSPTPGPPQVQVIGELQEVPTDIFRKLGDRPRFPISIQVARYPDALKIPAAAAFQSKNKWQVFKVVDRRAREMKVTILNRNNDEVMIGQGLAEGDTVINQPGLLVKDGVRVEMKQ